ncbi:MAG: DNA polymerase III subunit alpha [Alphaproteobacteria bacterium]
MSRADFIHLRARTAYSLTEGAIRAKDLAKLAAKQAMPAIAVTDHSNLFGALEFSLAAKDAGVQPIVGCTLKLAPEDEERGRERGGFPRPLHLPLLAQTEAGYRNLLALVSDAYLAPGGEPAPILSWDQLKGRTDALIALSGGVHGPVGRALAERDLDGARAALQRLRALFPDRLYVEVTRHEMPVEAQIEDGLVNLAYDLDLPLVATNDVYFETVEMYEAHDALMCIGARSHLSAPNRPRLTRQHRFKTAEEMRYAFADLPEAADNTLTIAQRCSYFPTVRKPILPAFDTAQGRDEPEELRAQARAGLEKHLVAHVFAADMDGAAREAAAAPYRERLEYELGVIVEMGFSGYFLIVSDFIQWAKDRGIPVGPGRGSGAGSVVAWALRITGLDPLRWGLLFERFLNPERVSMPDFDIDFCKDRRDEVIRYVQEKYGFDRVAQIITFGKLEARAALRDVGRVLEMPYGQVDRIAKLVPYNPAKPIPLGQAIESEPRLVEMRDSDEGVARLIDIALKLEGLYRNASTHAAGVVIGDRPLSELTPLYKDPASDMPVTQFNMKFVEQAGLVKFDFLGLKTLTVLHDACALIRAGGVEIDLDRIPLDDPATYEMLGRADTVGVFQLESGGMRDVLRKLKPDRFEDIIAVVALYRPGPMENIPSYINRKHGREQPDYLYPTLEPILKETYGIMIYQEQVIQIAQVLAGYTLGGADLLRRAMGKKIQAEMDAQRATFIEGAMHKGVGDATAARIFDQVDKFAGYGFNKSHAAAYALVAYHTAYLKANHPVAFMAASMTHDMGNTDKLNVFRQELSRLKVPLLPPDVNRSDAVFGVEEHEGRPAIRYALAAIKGVGRQAMDDLVAERRAGGRFADLFDLAYRLDAKVVNKRQLENLVCAGAFDSLLPNRARTFDAVEMLVKWSQAAQAARASTQTSLFGGGERMQAPRLPDVHDWDAMERLRREFEAIGFYLTAHPLNAYEATLKRIGVVEFGGLRDWLQGRSGGRPSLAGVVLGVQERTSNRTGNRFAHVTLSDASGSFEVTLFSELLAVARDLLAVGSVVVVAVDVQQQDDDMRLTAQRVESLEARAAQSVTNLRIFIDSPKPLPLIRSAIEQADAQAAGHNGSAKRGQIQLVIDAEDQEVEIALPRPHFTGGALRAAVKGIAGVIDVHELA